MISSQGSPCQRGRSFFTPCPFPLSLASFFLLLSAAWPLLCSSAHALGRVPQFESELMMKQLQEASEPLCTDANREQFEWNHMRWIPSFAAYRVQGFPIDELDPQLNFRRGYALGFTGDTEDKFHLLPFLRAVHDMSLQHRPRRVLLDFGGKDFASSVLWFLRMYPLSFTEVHAFEGVRGRFKVPLKNDEENPCVGLSSVSRLQSRSKLQVPTELLRNIHLHENLVGVEDKPAGGNNPDWINITRFMKEELGLTANDTVVVKMDIDGGEWAVLPEWMKDPDMPMIIDDLFVEMHYNHPSMHRFRWFTHPQSRVEALSLLLNLRSKDFFVHPWP